ELPEAEAIIRHIAWMPDSRYVLANGQKWWVYDVRGAALGNSNSRTELWAGQHSSLEQLAWSQDGKWVAGIARKAGGGSELWTLRADGSVGTPVVSAAILSFPVWTPDGRIACLAREGLRQTLSIPCGTVGVQEAYGALDFSPDGRTIYFAAPNPRGTLD